MAYTGQRLDCRIYVGNLPYNCRAKDLDDLFFKFGQINSIDIKTGGRGNPFGFVEFEDPRDAEDAVSSRDGYNLDGYRLRVEFSRGGKGVMGSRGMGAGAPSGYDRFRSGGPAGFRSGGGGGGGGSGGGRHSDYRVLVTEIPVSGSWQDLKDHMRDAGDVCFADVFKDGTGVVEYVRQEDMKYAIKKLDGSKFRSHQGDSSIIRVTVDPKYSGRQSSRSPSPGRYSSRRRDSRSTPPGGQSSTPGGYGREGSSHGDPEDVRYRRRSRS